MKAKKYIATALVTIILMCVLCISVFSATPTGSVKKIKVGFFESYGFSSIAEDGTLSGLLYEYLMEISNYTGWEYEFVIGDLNDLIGMLETGELDLMGGILNNDTINELVLYPEYSSGYTSATLNVLADNSKIASEDYKTLQNITVGVYKNAKNRITSLEKFMTSNSINYTTITFETTDDMEAALESGVIDAILTSDTQKIKNQRIVASFAREPYYFVTPKKNVSILNQLNSALQRINSVEPNYATDLKEKYFPLQSFDTFILSDLEKEYIKNIDTLDVAVNPSLSPIQYIDDNGNFNGVLADVFDTISNRTGIKFNFVKTNTFTESLELVKNKQVDLLSGINNSSELATEYNLVQSTEFLPLNMGIVSNDKVNLDIKSEITIAMATGQSLMNATGKETLIYFDTVKECIDAVNKGTADCTYSSAYVVEKLMQEYKYPNVVFTNIVNQDAHFTIGLVKPVSAELLTIINKAILSISNSEIQSYVLSNTLGMDNKISLATFINSNPLISIMSITVVILLAAAAIVYVMLTKLKNDRKLFELANIDDITGYINFSRFKIVADEMLKTDEAYMLIFFDVNKFKIVNDIFGHQKGNEILKKISDILKNNLSEDEIFARINADNFNVLMLYENDEDAIARITKLSDEISKCIDGYHIELSFGIYKIGNDVDTVVKMSDRANLAKMTIKGRVDAFYAFFDEEVRNNILKEKEIENIMEQSLRNNEFELYLQPKFTFSDEKIVGAEALVRWNNKDKGMIYPNDFIPLFEKNGFIQNLDKYMFEKVCMFLSNLKLPKDADIPSISVNFSRIHLNNLNLVDELIEITSKYGINPHNIEVELTETAIFDNEDRMIKAMTELKEAGFGLSIDDFGSGYSCLNTLKNLPVDSIKFDRGFLLESSDNIRGKNIIKNLVLLTRSLNLITVAEGVETIEQVNFLRDAGCDIAQGYYYAKPMPSAQFEDMLS